MPEALMAPRGGLFTKEDVPVPLAGVVVDAEMFTLCARVTVTQRYVNHESKPIEAVYLFPLEEGAAVCGFEAIIDGTIVVGEVKEREEAFMRYDDAMAQGHGAYLLDEERPDVFQASVGNLPPGKEVLLRLTYVTELSIAGSAVRFAIPTTVSPRYAPAQDHGGIGRPDSETLNPPVAWSVPYGLDLTVRVRMGGAIARIESPSHTVAVSMNGQSATVTLSQRDAALDRDFVLSVESAALDAPRGWIEKDDNGTEAVAIAFVPVLPGTSVPAEIVFLVDRSGSMAGASIAEVRNALQTCLRSMTAGCAFNIVGFGSTFEPLFKASRAYDERSLADANTHVAALDANLGGTEILPALKYVLEQGRHGALPRQVVVLTDGQVTNTDAVLALAAEHASTARIFTFGIGASASHHLVKGLARAGGGVAELIHPGERIEAKVLRQFGRLLSPALTDVRVEWHGMEVTQAPSTIPPVYAGGRLLIYGFVQERRAAAPRVGATLFATAPSGPVSFDVEIDQDDIRPGRTIATLAARARIRELEESPAWTKTRGSRQADRKASAVSHEIVALSTRYGVISRETSFVAIERRETPVEGDVQLRRVPIALAAGWGGLDMPPVLRAAGGFRSVRHAAFDLTAPGNAMAWSSGQFQIEDGSDDERLDQPMMRSTGRYEAVSRDPLRDRMQSLVRLQRADGSWELSGALALAIDCRIDALEHAFRDVMKRIQPGDAAVAQNRDAERAWATALAIAWLEIECHRLEREWHMLVNKGHAWLADRKDAIGDSREWLAEAKQVLAP